MRGRVGRVFVPYAAYCLKTQSVNAVEDMGAAFDAIPFGAGLGALKLSAS